MTIDKNIFFETAWRIGMSLVSDAIRDDKGRCNWTGGWIDNIEGKFTTTTRSFGPDIYCGTAGVICFLSHLYLRRQDPFLERTITGGVAQILSKAGSLPDHGFYSGKPGTAYVLARAGTIMERPDWITAAQELLGSIKTKGFNNLEQDVISGMAGSIPALKLFAGAYDKDRYTEMAVLLGKALCDKAVKENNGWSWHTLPDCKNPTGFSHGTAGIVTALLDVYELTGDAACLEAAQQGINYEQYYYNPVQKNWPDFRDSNQLAPGTYNYNVAWCHGAPGIALSRIHAARIKTFEALEVQAEAALETTYQTTLQLSTATSPLPNFSLCHGIAGNADILLFGNKPEYHELAIRVGLLGIERYDRPHLPWPGGTAGREKTPGMMMGLAGTGYYYLRLYDTAYYDSMLLPSFLKL